MTADDYITAHEHSIRHRSEIEASNRCGCFHCLAVFVPPEIERWIDEPNPPGATALCPKCGIDAVIGSAAGYPINEDFLKRMRVHWFSTA